jgi:hypothetical protein
MGTQRKIFNEGRRRVEDPSLSHFGFLCMNFGVF